MSECYSAVTGWDTSIDDLLVMEGRIGTMRMAFALREGINPLSMKFPDIAIAQLPFMKGPTKDISLDIETLKKEGIVR